MSRSYRLSWKRAPVGLVDASSLRADVLGALSISEVRALEITHGSRRDLLDELFHVEETTALEDSTLTLEGSSLLARLGADMAHGRVVVEGPSGRLTGAGLRGGSILVRGDAGPLAGAGMNGGLLIVEGDAGALLGGPLPGATRGMAGGEIFVRGDAGERTGLRLRRGVIAIGGRADRGLGHHMRAGTIVVRRTELEGAGIGMQRGSIVALHAEGSPAVSFRLGGIVRPTFLALLFRRLDQLEFEVPAAAPTEAWQSFSGDHLALGRGEILVPA